MIACLFLSIIKEFYSKICFPVFFSWVNPIPGYTFVNGAIYKSDGRHIFLNRATYKSLLETYTYVIGWHIIVYLRWVLGLKNIRWTQCWSKNEYIFATTVFIKKAIHDLLRKYIMSINVKYWKFTSNYIQKFNI